MVMSISATPKLAILIHASDDETLLRIECTAKDNSGVLEIGKEHVFASRKNRGFFSKRHACELVIRIKRKSSVSEEGAAKLGLSKDKIGELCFCPRSAADEVSDAIPESLEASVFLDDQFFERLLNTLLPGTRPQWLQLEIEREGTLGYGWEPDGSRRKWKIESPSDPAFVNITSIAMGTEL